MRKAGLLLVLGLAAACSVEMPTEERRLQTFWDSFRAELTPGMSTEEKSIALSEWIVRNSTNYHPIKNVDGLPFFGRCGYRASVFEAMAHRAGLRVARVAIENFGETAHTAVEVLYDDGWHFFDVTYAGYFQMDGKVLSFAEIQAHPREAISNMVVIEGSLDRWPDGREVDNHDRMALNYTEANIANARRLASP